MERFHFVAAPTVIGIGAGLLGVVGLIWADDPQATRFAQNLLIAGMGVGIVMAGMFYLLALAGRRLAYEAGVRRPLPWMAPAAVSWWTTVISLNAMWIVSVWQLVTTSRLWA